MSIPKLTLDTSVLLAHWKQEPNWQIVEKLVHLNDKKVVELGVTARIREDISKPPKSTQLTGRLNDLDIIETASGATLGKWRIGRDMLGSEQFARSWPGLLQLATKRVKGTSSGAPCLREIL